MSENKNIKFRIVTPERILFEEEVDQVSLPTQQGEITVLPNHIPLISILQPGELRFKKGGEEIPMVVSGGFIEVQPFEVTVLADTAERIEEIVEERAEEARKRAEEAMKAKKLDAKEYAYLVSKIEKELARVRVVKKYKKLKPQITSQPEKKKEE